ncbi:hypothetical protein DQ04_03551130 [Trypanosoma grayi]|uniref:hypothetical protein n=1 Tax=Trypanosoma grayi TaxID=71804 RepID=UPI0004F4617B|nr:hypothetical protein DQ04_03551130 [Trypanosoma grayi]KEG10582.1 hypothetical protein DQ04_03551130 [Trypanosoma grayi]
MRRYLTCELPHRFNHSCRSHYSFAISAHEEMTEVYRRASQRFLRKTPQCARNPRLFGFRMWSNPNVEVSFVVRPGLLEVDKTKCTSIGILWMRHDHFWASLADGAPLT